MKSLATLALFAATAVAQTATTPSGSSTTTSSTCAAQSILDACLGTENGQLSACQSTDYSCQCNAYKNIVTCYNNCPGDNAVSSAQGQVQIFCAYASQFASTSTAASTVGGSSSSSSSTGASAPASTATTPTSSGSSSGTSTSASAAASKTNGAAELALNAGGVLAAVAGVVIAVL